MIFTHRVVAHVSVKTQTFEYPVKVDTPECWENAHQSAYADYQKFVKENIDSISHQIGFEKVFGESATKGLYVKIVFTYGLVTPEQHVTELKSSDPPRYGIPEYRTVITIPSTVPDAS